MIAQVFHVIPLAQCILRDDIEIAAVERWIALVVWRLRALAEDHVSRHKASGIGPSDHHAPRRQILQHVMAKHPSEPMISLTAGGLASPEGEDGQDEQGRGQPERVGAALRQSDNIRRPMPSPESVAKMRLVYV